MIKSVNSKCHLVNYFTFIYQHCLIELNLIVIFIAKQVEKVKTFHGVFLSLHVTLCVCVCVGVYFLFICLIS